MVRSVEEILQKEFGRSLGDKGVHILDPFVGTGNFIVRIMQEIKATDLQYKYENGLHCNEVMLLPYYIASMNIEHAYFDRTDEYRAFPGICLVDTFDMASQKAFSEKNTQRIEAQLQAPIFVVIGNPPYNAWQVNENDNNKNRKYQDLDDRVSETYAKASRATNKSALSDPYVKAIRWASDRIKDEGVVALVTNGGFLEALAADGMRLHLAADFDEIYILDLGGNVRKNPKLSGTTHNVFGIQVGVSINLFVRRKVAREKRRCSINYASSESFWTRWQKYDWLESLGDRSHVAWKRIEPDSENNWLAEADSGDFQNFLPIATNTHECLFAVISNGVQTNRDAWVYNFAAEELYGNVERLTALYNQQVRDWKAKESEPERLDSFLETDDTRIKWSSRLKERLLSEHQVSAERTKVRNGLYRPFVKQYLYFDETLVHRRGQFPHILPVAKTEGENCVLWLKVGADWPMFCLATNIIPDQLPQGGSQCFPFYTYDEDGTHRRENITDWALEQFRAHYQDPSITKWDIFHYIYAVLHHPEYRECYAANLRRELPRIPFASVTIDNAKIYPVSSVSPVVKDFDLFGQLAKAGQRLAEIHVHYEQQPEYKLTKVEKKGEKLDYRVNKMKLSKDKTKLIYNQFLTLSGIPRETYDYRLGNRSALEWVIDQYQISTDKRSGITNDPNREDDKGYILRLIGQVITVSLETANIVATLPKLVF
jgi:predicted helicase